MSKHGGAEPSSPHSSPPSAQSLGDMDPEDFRRHAHQLADWIAQYFSSIDLYPVLSRVQPGEIRAAIPGDAPEDGESFEAMLADFERVLMPGVTHWNHPGFFAYFAISGSGPGVLADFLSSALNVQAMLWRTSPAATELEEVTLGWLRKLIGLPDSFEGVIYDTASISTLHGLAAAREVAVPEVRAKGLAGRKNVSKLRVYCSEHAHSSVDKAVILLGLGHEALKRIPADGEFRMKADALEKAIEEDLAAPHVPSRSSPPSARRRRRASIRCRRSHASARATRSGCTSTPPTPVLPRWFPASNGFWKAPPIADSLVVNPHKWLFTPFDLSAFYCRRMDVVRQAFALTPDYLKTVESAPVHNLMDTGIQLGRRFRALKLWMVMRHFGASGLRARIAEHMRLARLFADWIDASDRFERVAPVHFSVVCFRANGDDAFNEGLLDTINARW